MTKPTSEVEIAVRIPTDQLDPVELFSKLPEGFYCDDNCICDDSGALAGIFPRRPDAQFTNIFRTSCRVKPKDEEICIVDQYKLNICLCAPGGSLDAVWDIMQAASAVLHATKSGIFIDNSGLAHGASQWIDMTEDGSIEAMSFAFINLVRGKNGIYTYGMNAFGRPDLELGYNDVDDVGSQMVDLVQHVCSSEESINAGDWVGGEDCPHYQAVSSDPAIGNQESVMYNPFGKLRMVRLKDIAELN